MRPAWALDEADGSAGNRDNGYRRFQLLASGVRQAIAPGRNSVCRGSPIRLAAASEPRRDRVGARLPIRRPPRANRGEPAFVRMT